MENKQYLTKEKHQELQKELDFLKKTKRKEIADQLEFAKSLGDLAENAEYHEARELQAMTEDRIRRLEHILSNAEIVSKKKSDSVVMGSTVVVKKVGNTTKREFEMVGAEESNTAEGKLSYLSPLGKALMGKKRGEEFEFETPGGKVKYKIISVK